jgi:hypothetical protein
VLVVVVQTLLVEMAEFRQMVVQAVLELFLLLLAPQLVEQVAVVVAHTHQVV